METRVIGPPATLSRNALRRRRSALAERQPHRSPTSTSAGHTCVWLRRFALITHSDMPRFCPSGGRTTTPFGQLSGGQRLASWLSRSQVFPAPYVWFRRCAESRFAAAVLRLLASIHIYHYADMPSFAHFSGAGLDGASPGSLASGFEAAVRRPNHPWVYSQ